MVEKLLIAIAAGIAAAKLTESQQAAVMQPVNNWIDETTVAPAIEQDLPRGIRNNNPANIRYDGTTWQGLDDPASDGAFCRFIDVRYGIRAIVKILNSYAARGLVSIRDIVSTWAPATENNVESYIYSVSVSMNYPEDEPIPEYKRADLIAAMIKHENGMQPYTVATINEGVAWA
jgi:hypothetical protein